MMANIAFLRAFDRHFERVFNPDRKDTRWGKRKLKRDEKCPPRNNFFVPAVEQQFRFALFARQCQCRRTGADGAFSKARF
jgi:hypothetical protein